MKNIFDTRDNNYILFEKSIISIIIDNMDNIWFNAKQVARAIGYKDAKDALKNQVSKKDKIFFININHSYNIKQQPKTLYINEAGLYKLILRSKLQKAQIFTDWVTYDVLPSIRKYGYYKMKKDYENEKTELLNKINYLQKNQTKLQKDLKKNKYPNGALVYIVDYSDEDEALDGVFKLGKTDNMTKRKAIYDTHTLHKKDVVCMEITDKPLQLESCIRSMLYDYKYKNRKDFFICKKSIIKKAFTNCINSIKDMNQTGGGENNIIIDKIDAKINRLDKKIAAMDVLLK
jgi:prophage antirepressor-like protein